MDNKGLSAIKAIGGGIVTIVIALICYCVWINSSGFKGEFFGTTFRMPLETVDHYCYRKANHVFVYDNSEKEKCIREEKTKQTKSTQTSSDIHAQLKTHVLKTFADERGNTITGSQAECVTKSIEKHYNEPQIKRIIAGGKIGDDETSASNTLEMMSEVYECVGL